MSIIVQTRNPVATLKILKRNRKEMESIFGMITTSHAFKFKKDKSIADQMVNSLSLSIKKADILIKRLETNLKEKKFIY